MLRGDLLRENCRVSVDPPKAYPEPQLLGPFQQGRCKVAPRQPRPAVPGKPLGLGHQRGAVEQIKPFDATRRIGVQCAFPPATGTKWCTWSRLTQATPSGGSPCCPARARIRSRAGSGSIRSTGVPPR